MKYFSFEDGAGQSLEFLEKGCKTCLASCTTDYRPVSVCPIFQDKRRQGKWSSSKGTVVLCSNDEKTTALFKKKLEGFALGIQSAHNTKEQYLTAIRREEQKRVNRLIHNLTSINGYSIQELYDLVSQDELARDFQGQISKISEVLKNDPKAAAITFLKVSKHNLRMRSEFSVYDKLLKGSSNIDFQRHKIHRVVTNVIHTFYSDFLDKSVYVKISPSDKHIFGDYELLQVALYHLLENAAKYSIPNSELHVVFKEVNNAIEATFSMDSSYIEEHERELIFTEGYSGVNAKRSLKSGNGIGMFRIKQVLDLNKAHLEITCGSPEYNDMSFKYARNSFKLVFQKPPTTNQRR